MEYIPELYHRRYTTIHFIPQIRGQKCLQFIQLEVQLHVRVTMGCCCVSCQSGIRARWACCGGDGPDVRLSRHVFNDPERLPGPIRQLSQCLNSSPQNSDPGCPTVSLSVHFLYISLCSLICIALLI